MRVMLIVTVLLPMLIALSLLAWVVDRRRWLAVSAIMSGIVVGRVSAGVAW